MEDIQDIIDGIAKILRKSRVSLTQEQILGELTKQGINSDELSQKVYVCLNTYPEFRTYDEGGTYFLDSHKSQSGKPTAKPRQKRKPVKRSLAKFLNQPGPDLEEIVKPKKKGRKKAKNAPEQMKLGGLRSEMYAIMTEFKVPMNEVRLAELLRNRGYNVNANTPALIRVYFEQYPEFKKSDVHARYYVAVEKPDNGNA